MPKNLSPKKKLTRRQQRDLDIEIGFIEGIVARDPHYVEALQILGDDYTQRGKLNHGLRVDERLARLRPDDYLVLYNLSCSYSLTNQLEGALSALSRAIDCGYDDFRWLARDPDLINLRNDPRFKRIQAKIRSVRLKLKQA